MLIIDKIFFITVIILLLVLWLSEGEDVNEKRMFIIILFITLLYLAIQIIDVREKLVNIENTISELSIKNNDKGTTIDLGYK